MDKSKIIKGFLIAPLVPGLFWSIATLNPAVLIFAIPIAYLSLVIIGLPLFYISFLLKKLNFLTVTVGGILSALIPPLVYGSPEYRSFFGGETQDFLAIILFIIFGIMASTTFWYIAIKDYNRNNESLEETG